MTNRKDGGDAFPCAGNPEYDQFMPGMSLRDWFAGMALQGFLAHPSDGYMGDDYDWYTEIPKTAYKYADAMLAEREKARGA